LAEAQRRPDGSSSEEELVLVGGGWSISVCDVNDIYYINIYIYILYVIFTYTHPRLFEGMSKHANIIYYIIVIVIIVFFVEKRFTEELTIAYHSA